MAAQDRGLREIINRARRYYEDGQQRTSDAVTRYREARRYYDGEPDIVDYYEGSSRAVSADFRAVMRKVLPPIMRTLFGQDEVVIYHPVGEEDEEAAAQATQYVNQIVVPENDLERYIEGAIKSACFCRIGWLHARHAEVTSVKVTEHDGLTDEEVAILEADEGVTILERRLGGDGWHVRIRRQITEGKIIAEAVPVDQIIVDPDAVTIDEAAFVARVETRRIGEVVALGHDPEQVRELAALDSSGRERLIDVQYEQQDNEDLTDLYDVYLRHDADGDGIEEVHNLTFIGGISERQLVAHEVVAEVPFFPVVIEHGDGLEGESLFDDVKELQRVRTELLRQTLNNIYGVNNPTPAVIPELLEDLDAIYNPVFGKPIRIRPGARVNDVIQWNVIPYTAGQTFQMLEYLDREMQDRTGVSDASAGLAPKDLQNMTATATALVERTGVGRIEQYIRTIAGCLKPFFRHILRLIVRHSDKRRIVRLRNRWVPIDPRSWNADMDCSINIGFGAGSRERDLMAIQFVLGLQREILQSMGPVNPFVKPENLYNTLRRAVEAAGLRTPSLYISEPAEEEVQQLLQLWASKLQDPEMAKAQAQIEIEKAKAAATLDIERMKADVAKVREAAQLEADLKVRDKEAQLGILKAELEAETRKEIERMRLDTQVMIEELRAENARALKMLEVDIDEYRRLAEKIEKLERELAGSAGSADTGQTDVAGGQDNAGE